MVPPSRQDDTREQESGDGIGRRLILGAGLAGLAGIAAFSRTAHAGPINPPAGPIASTGRTVQEIYDKVARTDFGLAEPRIPVQSLPGSATAQYVISQPGSYYLTGNIQGVAGKNGIQILARNVTLDLSGFSLIGTIDCKSAIVIGLEGVNELDHVHIRNGSIREWGGYGVDGESAIRSSVTNLSLHRTGWNGAFRRGSVYLRGDSLIADCLVQQCLGTVQLNERGVIARCIANGNDPGGFFMVRDGMIVDCEVVGCNGNAFTIQEGGLFLRNYARNVNGAGTWATRGAVVRDCVFINCNEGVLSDGGRVRIEAVHASECSVNGIRVIGSAPGTVIDQCSTTLCATGYRVESSGNLIRRSTSSQGAAGFVIAAGNSFGPIVNVAGVGNIAGVANANHPWANFIY
jgi:hypothetical protein